MLAYKYILESINKTNMTHMDYVLWRLDIVWFKVCRRGL